MSGTLKLNDTVFATENNGAITTDASTIKVGGTTVVDSNRVIDVSEMKVGGNTVIDSNRKMTGVDVVPTSSMMFRNRIINGHLKSSKVLNQRGASSITGASGYTFDRWYYDGSTYLYQGIEDANVQNGTYVISWEGSGISAAWKVSTDSTANNGPDATTGFTSVSNGGTFTVNETTEFSKHLWIQFSGTLSNLDKVQVELGTVATPFEHRPYGLELSLCQRYFYRLSAEYTYTNFFQASWRASTDARGVIPFPVTMRAVPSFSTDGSITSLGNGTYSSLQLADSGSKYQGNMQLNGSSGTIGFSTTVRANNDATAGLNFTAEL